MRPVMKWAGGKSRLAEAIGEAFGGPCRGTWYEPFTGSAAVFLARKARGQVKRAVLSDVNAKLMAMHRAVRDDVEGVLSALDAMPKDDWRERYYDVRAAYNEGPFEGPKHAARLLWLNRAGYNGLYRENRKGQLNVPVGRYARLSIPSADHFRKVSELLQDTEIVSSDFADVMADAGDDDQVYCDPPYVPLTATANFTAYSRQPFALPEQLDLAESALRAADRGAAVVLSNHDTELVRDEIYPTGRGFRYVATPEVSRAISRNGRRRAPVREVIVRIG